MSISSTRVSKKRECETQALQCPKKLSKRSSSASSRDFEILSQLKLQLENLQRLEYDYDLVTRVEQLYSKYVKAPLKLKNTNSLPSTVPKGSNTSSIKIQELYRQTLKKHNLPINYKTDNQEHLVLESLGKGDVAKVVFLCKNTTADLKTHYINLTISNQHPDTALEILKTFIRS